MDSNAVDKFAELFAKCAAAGDSAPLRKEAAAQSLVKEAITATQLLMPLGGAAIGGAAGYLGTDNEKRKLRNALYGALTGGVAGTGAQLASPMIKDILSRLSGGNSAAKPAQGGGQFSVAPEQSAAAKGTPASAAAAGTPETAAAPAAPASAASNAAPKPGNQKPTTPESDNHSGTANPLTTYREFAADPAGFALGYKGTSDALARFAPGRQYGFGNSLERISKAFPEVDKLLKQYRYNTKAPMAEFLAKPPAAPAPFTTPKPEFAEAAPSQPRAAPQRPLPPAGRTGKSRSGKPSATAAVPIKDYLQNLRRFAGEQTAYNDAVAAYPQQKADFEARRAAFPQSQAVKDWDAARNTAAQAAKQHAASTAAYNKEHTPSFLGRESKKLRDARGILTSGDMGNKGWFASSPVTAESKQMKMLEEMLQRQGTVKGAPQLDKKRLVEIADAVNESKLPRPSTWKRNMLGGAALGVGTEIAGQNAQNLLADALEQNPNYSLYDLGKDIYGTGKDMASDPNAFGQGLLSGAYDHYRNYFNGQKKK